MRNAKKQNIFEMKKLESLHENKTKNDEWILLGIIRDDTLKKWIWKKEEIKGVA